jgi:hypothetical protein
MKIILFVALLAVSLTFGIWLPGLLIWIKKRKEKRNGKRKPLVCAECPFWKYLNKMSNYGTCTKEGRNIPTSKTNKCLLS